MSWYNIGRFLGITENQREIDMDMREMVDKVKKGEPLYGISRLSEHHQAMAMRNSKNALFFNHVIPMFNFVNHQQVRPKDHRDRVQHSKLTLGNSTVLIPQNITNRPSASWK